MNEYSVKDKVVIVTGGTKGMGLASSTQLLKMGAKVVMVFAKDQENADQVAKQLSDYQSQFLIVKADICSSDDRNRIISETINTFKRIDVLVNNAGVPSKAGFLKETESDFDRVIDVNLRAPIFLARLVAEQMIQQEAGGSIINFSSVCGHRGMGGISYDAAKAGIIRATEAMANALGKHGIRVNSISPGMYRTEMNRDQWENQTDLYQGMIAATSLNRSANANEIAGTVVYLASDQSSYTTGTDILADGGYLIHSPGR